MAHIDDEAIVIPAEINPGIIIAVHAPASSPDDYWIGEVKHQVSNKPLTYKLKYYDYTKKIQVWSNRIGGSGTAPHSSVLYAGIMFTERGQLPALVVRRLKKILQA